MTTDRICDADETASECSAPGCCTLMTAGEVYAWATIDGATARVCSERCLNDLSAAEIERITCTFCELLTPIDDRIAVTNGGVAGVAHSACQARVTNALGVERSAMLAGKGWGVLGGGRS